MGTISEIRQIRQTLLSIERQIAKPYCNVESLKEKLEAATQKIYKAADMLSKKDREELDNLIMLKNIIKAKIEKR